MGWRHEISLIAVAAQFLTRLPVPAFRAFQTAWLPQSTRYFPLLGAVIGSACALVWWLSATVLPPAIAVGLMLSAGLLLTGALHEDGFADACDGFGGGRSQASILAIMKDSRVGAFGVMGICLLLGLKWLTLSLLNPLMVAASIVVAHTLSRWCAIALSWRLTYVREDDTAKSTPWANSLNAKEWLLSGAVGALAVTPWIVALAPDTQAAFLRALWPAVGLSALTAVLAGVYFKSRIGGYTGDCLGAAQQSSELVFLLGMLACKSF